MYTVDPAPIARSQISQLPAEALRPLSELFTLLELAPWSGLSLNPGNPKANILTHAFGASGMATYMVLEEEREVYVLQIDWI